MGKLKSGCNTFSTTQVRKYLKQAHKAKDKSAVKSIYKDYRKSGGKLPLSKAIK